MGRGVGATCFLEQFVSLLTSRKRSCFFVQILRECRQSILEENGLLESVMMLDHDGHEQNQFINRDNIEHVEVSYNRSAGNGDFAYWKYRLESLKR